MNESTEEDQPCIICSYNMMALIRPAQVIFHNDLLNLCVYAAQWHYLLMFPFCELLDLKSKSCVHYRSLENFRLDLFCCKIFSSK